MLALIATVLVVAAVALYDKATEHPAAGGSLGAATSALIERPVNTPPPAPPFRATLLGGGRTLSRGQLAGKVIVLVFWSSWCEPCRRELGAMEQARRQVPADVEMVGDDVEDNAARALASLQQVRATYPSLWDPHGSIARSYRVIGTPTIVFIDAVGRIRARALGPTSAATIRALTRGAA